jgi:hypothetical protein
MKIVVRKRPVLRRDEPLTGPVFFSSISIEKEGL